MEEAARGGNLELVRWLRGEGCPWDALTCYAAVDQGHVEVLRWLRENGCPWMAEIRDKAAAELGYTDDLGNLLVLRQATVGTPVTGIYSYWTTE